MDLTSSYRDVFPEALLGRYEFVETRNAAAIFKVTNPAAFGNLLEVLGDFSLTKSDLINPGGSESEVAGRLNSKFRGKGWHEARVDTRISLSLILTPNRDQGETELPPLNSETFNEGYKVDNFLDRVALDVEWNAKDGNLDRDLSAYRSLYESALIDCGVLITRTQDDLRELGKTLGISSGMSKESARKILGTTTTTNLVKLVPRLTRGDAGGCPILAICISSRTFDESQ